MQQRIDYKKINFEIAKEFFAGKNVVFTGRGFLVRGELMRLARQAGANVDSVVTKKCDILIVGEKPGSKLRKAKVLGCEIISTDDFRNILEGVRVGGIYKLEATEEMLNINITSSDEEKINILGKNIAIIVENQFLKDKLLKRIRDKGGNIVTDIANEVTDILVYQPNSSLERIIERAKSLDIQVFTVGTFNKMILES